MRDRTVASGIPSARAASDWGEGGDDAQLDEHAPARREALEGSEHAVHAAMAVNGGHDRTLTRRISGASLRPVVVGLRGRPESALVKPKLTAEGGS
jgi:hypothetical protein